MLKPLMRPAIVAAVLLASASTQAHQYAQQISSWTARLQSTEKTIRDVRCSQEDLDNLITCEPANTARVVARLLDRMENGDVLIVTKLDRLGRNAMDVRKTVEQLATSDIRVHCLALGGVDLTSPAGKMTMQVISAVAEFGKDLLIERTHSGIARARASGKHFGRPSSLNGEQQQVVLERLNAGASISAIAREFGTSRQTVIRLRDKARS
ncbi:recombinase family protein [Citrobacter portucalensis]|uniref:recombinase family protein n=1 Tax=Citrobacter portucalensis TaxID=1639133 RepID=UPI00226BAC8C|nr:recombinase family protein [Citrobacter portucalensis]MCX8985119.1 recombinase family protein [Citrobacter portucalensis]